jgi:hypothetical protein
MARALGLLAVFVASSADAYITAPVQTLGKLCESTYITLVEVEKFNREKGVIIYRKVRDLKGQYPRDRIRHAFDLQNTPLHKGLGDVPVRPDAKDWQYATGWAEVGKTAVIFSLKYDPYGDFGHTYIDGCWYATMCPARDWDFWWAIYADPALLTRWHCGKPADLAAAVDQILAGKTAVVPSLAGGTRDDLRAGKGRIQGLKVGLQLADFNLDRDRVAIGPPREIPALIKDLDHADRQVRLEALAELARHPATQETMAALERVVSRDSSGTVRMRAADALGKVGPDAKAARPALEAALKDPAMAQRPEVLAKIREVLDRLK